MRERLARLAGDGKGGGGGLPLPAAFAAALQELVDNGPQPSGQIAETVSHAISYKEKRVLVTWNSWDEFTGDVMAQLAEAGLVEEMLGKWYLTLSFKAGQRHVVIPESDIGVTVHPKGERDRRNALARAALDVRRTGAQLRKSGVADPQVTAAVNALLALLDSEGEPELAAGRKTRNPEKTKAEIEQAILDLKAEGKVPSSREVMRRMGRSDDRNIRKAWDDLAAEGRVSPRPTEYSRRGSASISKFTEQYMREHPGCRFTVREVADAFDAAHPDENPVSSGPVTQKLDRMCRDGLVRKFPPDAVHRFGTYQFGDAWLA